MRSPAAGSPIQRLVSSRPIKRWSGWRDHKPKDQSGAAGTKSRGPPIRDSALITNLYALPRRRWSDSAYIHFATPPWREQAPVRTLAWL